MSLYKYINNFSVRESLIFTAICCHHFINDQVYDKGVLVTYNTFSLFKIEFKLFFGVVNVFLDTRPWILASALKEKA